MPAPNWQGFGPISDTATDAAPAGSPHAASFDQRPASCEERRVALLVDRRAAGYKATMSLKDGDYFAARADEARMRACDKTGGREARVAGHLALAYEALARAKAEKAGAEDSDD